MIISDALHFNVQIGTIFDTHSTVELLIMVVRCV